MRARTAKYKGTCSLCGRTFKRGTQIIWTQGETYHLPDQCPELRTKLPKLSRFEYNALPAEYR